MRITKEPEERKQEILDTAMRLFYEKGYEKTSITDIAKAIGVAQGLCYRYFPSKEALFDSAIDQYAEELVRRFSIPADSDKRTLREIVETMSVMVETENSDYYKTLHVGENKKFHDLPTLFSGCFPVLPYSGSPVSTRSCILYSALPRSHIQPLLTASPLSRLQCAILQSAHTVPDRKYNHRLPLMPLVAVSSSVSSKISIPGTLFFAHLTFVCQHKFSH